MNTLSDKELLAIYNRGDDWSMISILRDVQSAILAANPATANDGYILIDTEEKRKRYSPKLATDEIRDGATGEWETTKFNDEIFRPFDTYRRRLESGWRLVSEGVTYPCEFSKAGTEYREIFYGRETVKPDFTKECMWTHFRPLILPPPPVKEQTECEKAFHEHYGSIKGYANKWEVWKTCWPIAQKEKGEK